jgi:hypothetical protein
MSASGQKRTSARYSIISLARSKIDGGMSMPTGQKPAFENAMAQVGYPDRRINLIHTASATGSAAHEFASRPRCAVPPYQGVSFSAFPGTIFTILARAFLLLTSMTVTASPVLS